MAKHLHKLKPDESREYDAKPIYLTQAGIDALHRELARLKERAPGLALEAQRTAAYGDRSDNAEYKQAKGSLRRANFRILEIEAQLKRVALIPSGPGAGGTVQLGSVVELEVLNKEGAAGGASTPRKTFHIVGPNETDPTRGRISHLSPLGAALIGRHNGDIVSVDRESGKQEYQITNIK